MCVALLAHGVIPGWPLFAAANRDEFFDRPAAPPARSTVDGTRAVTPTDLRAGGSWIGVNEHGLVAALTNRSDLPMPLGPLPSRGALVPGFLAASDVDAAVRRLPALLAPRRWPPFNLLLADPGSAIWIDGARAADDLPGAVAHLAVPGIHALSDRAAPGAGDRPEVRKLLARARELAQGDPWLVAESLLGDTSPPPICRTRRPDRGTVSASIIGVDDTGGIRYRYADGPPDRTPFAPAPSPRDECADDPRR